MDDSFRMPDGKRKREGLPMRGQRLRRGWRVTEPLASSEEAKPKRDGDRREGQVGGGRRRRRKGGGGWGAVAASGAGLNINPRGRPGRAPGLVLFRLNSRNHAVDDARSLHKHGTREKYAQTLRRASDTRAARERKAAGTEKRKVTDDQKRVDAHAVDRAESDNRRHRRRR